MESLLQTAVDLAISRHKGQTDKAGKPYIFHPLYVMNQMKTMRGKIVAVMHDIIEDTETTLEELKEIGFDDLTLDAIDALSRRKGESKDETLKRTLKNKIAIKVKIEDIKHNMDLSRLKEITQKDIERNNQYQIKLNILIESIARK